MITTPKEENSGLYIVRKDDPSYKNGYCTPAEATKELILIKDGVKMVLNGLEMAQLYNSIRPQGTAPKMGYFGKVK